MFINNSSLCGGLLKRNVKELALLFFKKSAKCVAYQMVVSINITVQVMMKAQAPADTYSLNFQVTDSCGGTTSATLTIIVTAAVSL